MLDPAKVMLKQREQQEIIDDGDVFIAEELTPETLADIDRRTELYDVVAKDFSC